jgi:hypothetical protein
VFVLLFTGIQFGLGQSKQAKDYLKVGNYLDALTLLLKSYKIHPDNSELAHNIAICYLNTNVDKKAALLYIEKVYELSGDKVESDVIFEYALALTYHLKFTEAKNLFNQYKKVTSNGKYSDFVDRNIINCGSANQLINKPLNVTFKNLGNKINSKFPDYYPFVSKNDSILYFTSRRQGNLGGSKEFDGYYPSDIYYFLLNKDLTKAKNVGKKLNTTGDDQVVGLSNDGTRLFVYFDVVDHFGDIYMSENSTGNFSRNFKLDETINSKHLETSASISADGLTLFFASNRPGGEGGLDLYMSRKLPDGNWGLAQNLGNTVNTPYDEDFPQLSLDGNTLYYSSDGLPGMGGFDIFHAKWNKELNSWSQPMNMGYPLNTPADNMTISFSKNETYAYVSARRNDSYGDFDIYKVEFHDAKKSKAVFIFSTPIKLNTDELELIVSDENNEIIGIYLPNSKGNFIVILEGGQYVINLENQNGSIYTENLKVGSENFLNIVNNKTISIQ